MNHKSAASYEARTREYPPGTVGAMSKQLFVNTQVNPNEIIHLTTLHAIASRQDNITIQNSNPFIEVT